MQLQPNPEIEIGKVFSLPFEKYHCHSRWHLRSCEGLKEDTLRHRLDYSLWCWLSAILNIALFLGGEGKNNYGEVFYTNLNGLLYINNDNGSDNKDKNTLSCDRIHDISYK